MLRAGWSRTVEVALLTVALASCPLTVTPMRAADQDPPPGEADRTIAPSRPSAEAEPAERALVSMVALSTGLPLLDGFDPFEVQRWASWDLEFCDWSPVSEAPATEGGGAVEVQDAALWSSRPAIGADALVP